MTSLEIVNKEIELIHDQLNDYDEEDEEYGIYPSYDTLMYELNNYNKIKQDLEFLEILIKWKDYIHFDNCYDFLLDEEIEELESDIHFLINYLAHYKGYTPKCFRKVGDNNE